MPHAIANALRGDVGEAVTPSSMLAGSAAISFVHAVASAPEGEGGSMETELGDESHPHSTAAATAAMATARGRKRGKGYTD